MRGGGNRILRGIICANRPARLLTTTSSDADTVLARRRDFAHLAIPAHHALPRSTCSLMLHGT